MDPVQLVHVITRLRRQFGRQPDVLMACNELERLGIAEARRAVSEPRCSRCGSSNDTATLCIECITPKPIEVKPPKRDRAAYMRGYRLRKA